MISSKDRLRANRLTGELVRAARKRAGMSRAEAGKGCNRSASWVAAVECGRLQRVDVIRLTMLCDAIGMSCGALLKRIEREIGLQSRA